MKKGIFLLLAILIGAFVLHGCHSSTTLKKGSRIGYPIGHDMHPGAKSNENHTNGGYS